MRDLLLLAIHLVVTFAKLARAGGIRAVAAESLLLKHQLIIAGRSRKRAPNLTTFDRFVLGLTTLFISAPRLPKLAAVIKPATLFWLHRALVDGKYRLLFTSRRRRGRPGPRGPSVDLITAICSAPCPRALLSTAAVRVGWSFVADVSGAHERQPVERRPVPLPVHSAAQLLGHGCDGCIFAPHHRIRCRRRVGRRCFGLPDVQCRHRPPRTTEAREHRS